MAKPKPLALTVVIDHLDREWVRPTRAQVASEIRSNLESVWPAVRVTVRPAQKKGARRER